jgi:hypothetical protein
MNKEITNQKQGSANTVSSGAKSIIKKNRFNGVSSYNNFSDDVRGIISLRDNVNA